MKTLLVTLTAVVVCVLSLSRAQTPPKLFIEVSPSHQLRLFWTNAATGFVVEEVDHLPEAGLWSPVLQAPLLANQQFSVVLSNTTGSRFFRLIKQPGGIPPDSSLVAPPVAGGVATILSESTAFLYTGTNPIQTGVTNGTIVATRAAILRGKVTQRDNTPLSGVVVSILNHPEFGSTLSRLDGMFDLAVNGGGLLTVNYDKTGFCPVQRQVSVPWQDYVIVPRIVMIGMDPVVTPVALGANAPVQVHQASVQSDADGTRRAALLFTPGTSASLVLANGTTQAVSSLSIRATEFTVGTNGPATMPGVLPPSSGYTYCAELSADEAMALGATIQFDRPVMNYVENFLGFPVGTVVPVGYYDRKQAVWVPSQNGRVIKILSSTGGLADVDTNGDGAADTGESVTDVERQQLATLYAAGQTLWRVPIIHFTPWDHNWPFVPPADAVPPNQPPPVTDDVINDGLIENCGSIIEAQNQILGESLAIAGTPFTLNYRSDRVPGRASGLKVTVPVSGATVPASLKHIEVEFLVAGRQFRQVFPATSNQTATFTWDRLDAYGRSVAGRQPYSGTISYVYDAVYASPASFAAAFGRFGTTPLTANGARQETTFPQTFSGSRGGADARGSGLGGWTLSAHHAYDPVQRTLYLGSGQRQQADSVAGVIETVAGTGVLGFSGDGGPAIQSQVQSPRAIAVAPDGTYYLADGLNNRVRRVGPDGIITTVAGTGVAGSSGDGGPATQAQLVPAGLALALDGSLYISDSSTVGRRIRRVGLDGIITTIAGTGVNGFGGDGGPATQALFKSLGGLALSRDGSLYIADQGNSRIRRIGTDGIIITVAGTGTIGSSGDGSLATLARLNAPFDVVESSDGNLYIAEFVGQRIRRVAPDGIITTVAGNGATGFSGDGGPAILAQINGPRTIDVDVSGSLFIADEINNRIRSVQTDGNINTIAGKGGSLFGGEGLPATQARIQVSSVALSSGGSLLFGGGGRISRMAPALPGISSGDFAIPSKDGSMLHRFDSSGRHLQTLNALTSAPILEFGYDVKGRLTQIIAKTGGTDNVTTIQHDSDGNPTAIVSPDGLTTTLAVDANGFLSQIVNPAAETNRITCSPEGLLTAFTDARGHTSTYQYDSFGRLIIASDSCCGLQTYARTNLTSSNVVTRTTALGRVTTYAVQSLPGGGQRTVNRLPDGTESTLEFRPDGTQIASSSVGSVSTSLLGPDPRFGMAAAMMQSSRISLPNGLALTNTYSATAVLSNKANPFSFASLSNTFASNGRMATNVYTAATRTSVSTSPAGRTQSLTLDALGRPVTLQLPGLHSTTTAYDARGRLSGVTVGSGPDARSLAFTYNAQGFLDTVTDALGRTVHYGRDAVGRLTQTQFPDGSKVLLGYDAAGNLTSLTPPGRPAHTFTYGNRNELTTSTPPFVAGTGPTTHADDADGGITSITRPGGEAVHYTYEASGRPLQLSLTNNGGAAMAYTMSYNPTGLLASVAAPGGQTLNYSYTGFLITNVAWSGPVTGNVSRTFDDALRLVTESVNGDSTVAYTYDRDDLLTGAGDLVITRNAATGFPVSTALGGITHTQSHSGFGQVTNYTLHAVGNLLYGASFTRDAIGRLAQRIETVGGITTSFDYTYDLLGQLTAVAKDGVPIESYAYDANGNRTNTTAGGVNSGSTHDDQDRLLTHGSTSYDYTPAGRLRTRTGSGGTTEYAYDAIGNLLSATLPGGTSITYLLDGVDRRVGRQVNGVTVERYIYAGDQLIAQLDSSGAILSRFVYSGGFLPAYLVRGGVKFRIFEDHVGSVRLVVNATSGAIVQQMDYDSFGNVIMDTNPGFQPFGFAGGLYDPDTKLVRFGMRDYDPETGRWTAKDPIGIAGNDANLYRYCYNNPVNLTDPSGLATLDMFAGFLDHIFVAVSMGSNPFSSGALYIELLVNLAMSALGTESPLPPLLDAIRPLKNNPLIDGTGSDYNTGDTIGACTTMAAGAGAGLAARAASVAGAAEKVAAQSAARNATAAAAKAAAGSNLKILSAAEAQAAADAGNAARNAALEAAKVGRPQAGQGLYQIKTPGGAGSGGSYFPRNHQR